MNRSEKSAEVVVAAARERRAERVKVHEDVSIPKVMRQMPERSGRDGVVRGEAVREPASDETRGSRRDTEGTGSGSLLAAALTRGNLQQAWRRVKANKGSAGVDGLDIEQTALHLKTAWPEIRDRLLRGRYRPAPVRRVRIPKPDGGERELGIPTVTDRLIQQALLQVLQPLLDPTFSEHSYGFRPGRRAHEAVLAAQSYVQSGRRVVVDVDLEKFFDRVNHDILMDRLGRRIEDAAVRRLIRAYLDAGIMSDGVVLERYQGTPQGGPLSPLLANVLLDEVDRELERRGHCFARYADDCNVYVRSRKAGERVMALLRRLYARLRLTVNETKSAVASAFGRKFLGYGLWVAMAAAGHATAPRALSFKHTVQLWSEFTSRAVLSAADPTGALETLFRLIAQLPVGHRPHRSEPRARKRRPKSFPWLKVPRPVARQRPAHLPNWLRAK